MCYGFEIIEYGRLLSTPMVCFRNIRNSLNSKIDRRNAAEVAIRNFKAHFLSVLAGTAKDFPPSLWDRLLPQAEITVNLLQQSNATPNVLAYAHLSGPFDYNKMPLAPMGCAVQVHEKTDKQGTVAKGMSSNGSGASANPWRVSPSAPTTNTNLKFTTLM